MYAVVPAASVNTLGAIGLSSGEVCTIIQDAVAAVVSRIPSDRIRPERRNLAAHAAVLKALNDCTTVLPISFGTIVASEQSIHDTLRRNQELFLSQLKRVAGRIEMGLRVEWRASAPSRAGSLEAKSSSASSRGRLQMASISSSRSPARTGTACR
jgi:hypothetical protein